MSAALWFALGLLAGWASLCLLAAWAHASALREAAEQGHDP